MLECDMLKRYSLFGGLDDTQLGFVSSLLREESHHSGEVILKEGELNSKVYFIQEGTVGVDKLRCAEDGSRGCESRHIADLIAGDTFGEMELVDIQPCVATVTAETDVKLLTLSNVDLYALRKKDLKAFTLIIMNVARDISRRLRDMDTRFSSFQ
jgi:CRP-like cAMP-binding protein